MATFTSKLYVLFHYGHVDVHVLSDCMEYFGTKLM